MLEAPGVRFTTAPRTLVAYVERKGAYAGIGADMRSLKAWMDSKGIRQAGDPFCQFFDNPSETPEKELRSEACIPVAGEFESEGEFKLKEMREAYVAETKHSGAPEEFAKTYGPFLEGLLNQRYNIVGPAREYFKSPSEVKGPGSGYLIQQPVAKQ